MTKNIQPDPHSPYTKEELWFLTEINKRIERYNLNHSPLGEKLKLCPEEEHLPIFEFVSGHNSGYLEGLLFAKKIIEEKYKNAYQKRKTPHLISHIGGVQKKKKTVDEYKEITLFDYLEEIIENTNFAGCF